MDAMQRENIGARIRALREERRWSQDELARAAGVSARTIFSAEKGERMPQPKKLRAILDALGVAEQESGDIVIEGMPDDIAVFLHVAAQRLCVLDEDQRARVLAAIYPKLLGEIGGTGGQLPPSK